VDVTPTGTRTISIFTPPPRSKVVAVGRFIRLASLTSFSLLLVRLGWTSQFSLSRHALGVNGYGTSAKEPSRNKSTVLAWSGGRLLPCSGGRVSWFRYAPAEAPRRRPHPGAILHALIPGRLLTARSPKSVRTRLCHSPEERHNAKAPTFRPGPFW
jgi:hypothetical protein